MALTSKKERQMDIIKVPESQSGDQEMRTAPPSQVEQSSNHDDGALSEDPKFLPLTDDCYHYTKLGDFEFDSQKYWHQRYSIWSRYDEGIMMTEDAWYGVTPEPVANKVAEDLSNFTSPSKTVLIDMFAGAGGNVIAFALSSRWSRIIAIEKNPSVLACAQYNASIYGVSSKITWINDDSFSYLASHPIDPSRTIIFASPPWGGPRYKDYEMFDLSKMLPYSIEQIYEVCKSMDSALFLPRQSDLRQIARLVKEVKQRKIEVVQYCMVGASKALVAYIPADEPVS